MPLPDHGYVAYRSGLAVLVAPPRIEPPSWMVFDPRLEAFVAPGHRLPELRRWAREMGMPEEGAGELDPDVLDPEFRDRRTPREYQREAVSRWEAAGRRGSVVLPTGSGKTLVALLAVRGQGEGTLVVAPTRALVAQWFIQLADAFGDRQVGVWYGDEKDPRAITVTTYHSAFSILEAKGDRFGLLVLDEVHHLADGRDGSPSAWLDSLRIAPAGARLGLTATYPDGRASGIEQVVGPPVYRRSIGEMADRELAEFVTERRFVPLSPDEQERYRRADARYQRWLEAHSHGGSPQEVWLRFMAETRRSPAARRAFQAFLERERIVHTCRSKLLEAGRILRLHPAEQAILFCGSREAAEAVARHFAIPLVTADTPASERRHILAAMGACQIRALAAVQVLDEGWDVPGAKLGIVLGDSSRGGRRQHTQRLGRILRRSGDQVASFYELVAAETFEFFASQKRRAGLRAARSPQLGLGI